jgi:hypothetical protein
VNAVEYQRRAMEHRPTDAAGIAAEIRRLSLNGYSTRDIAGALKLDPIAVERRLQNDFHHESTLRTST